MANGTQNGTGWDILIGQVEKAMESAEKEEIKCPNPSFPKLVLLQTQIELEKMRRRRDGKALEDKPTKSSVTCGKFRAEGVPAVLSILVVGIVLVIALAIGGKQFLDKLAERGWLARPSIVSTERSGE